MTWGNYGKYGWHIDHIILLSNFDLMNPADLKKVCHFSNLQPLWAEENLRKGSKMSSITNVKVWPCTQGSGKAMANAQFTYDETLKVKCTLWKGAQGPFVGFPGNYGNKVDENGKKIFYPNISCLKDDVRGEINAAILTEYNKEIGNEGMNQGEGDGPTNQESSGKKTIPF